MSFLDYRMHTGFREKIKKKENSAISYVCTTHTTFTIFYSKNLYTVGIISSETFHCTHIHAVFINNTEHFVS
jgi:hypothetical protein